MATSSLGITLIANGTQSGSWGDTTNTNWQYMEDAVAGVYGLNLSGGTTYTFGTALLARYAVINVANAGGNATISFPAVSKVYIISNNSGYSVTLQVTGGGGSSVVVANTLTTLVYCDGANFNSGITGFTGGNLAITGSITASGSITGASFTSPSGIPQLAGGATGQIPYQTGSSATAYTPAPTTGSYLSWNGSAYTWSTGSVTTASNLSGGSTWSIPYQVNPGTTGFLTPSGSTPLTLQWNGSAVQWASGGAVSSFSAGTTGLLPSSPVGGPVVLSGVLNTVNGGTQVSSSGASGNVLVSNGTVWTSQTPISAGLAQLTNTGTQTFAGSINATGIQASYLGLGGAAGSTNYPLEVQAVGGNPGGTFYAGTTTYGVGLVCVADLTHTTGLCVFQSGTPGSPTGAGSIYLTSATSVNYATTSDRRLKTNISTLTNSGSFIDSLLPRTFNWVTDGASDSGFIADELQQIAPKCVSGTPNEIKPDGTPVYQNVDVSTPEMMANIIAELQTLRKRVAELEAK